MKCVPSPAREKAGPEGCAVDALWAPVGANRDFYLPGQHVYVRNMYSSVYLGWVCRGTIPGGEPGGVRVGTEVRIWKGTVLDASLSPRSRPKSRAWMDRLVG